MRDLELDSRAAEVFRAEQKALVRPPFERRQTAPAVRIDGRREVEIGRS